MANPNPLLEAYINQKDEEMEDGIKRWVHILRLVYDAAIKEGFTHNQAMKIVELQWKQSDKRYWKEKKLNG
jgi:hypothetical protein